MSSPDNICSSSGIQADKADAIRFIGGRYAGKTGWLQRLRRKRGSTCYYVLVDLGDNTVVKTSYVQIDNIGTAEVEEPASYATAFLQQHVDIELTMKTLARQLASCSIDKPIAADHCTIFALQLNLAILKQANKGSKGRYRNVDFEF
jgi:hypothetical protein